MSTVPLDVHLRRLGLRATAVHALLGTWWGLAAVVTTAAAAVWFDLVWELPADARWAVRVIAPVVGVAVLIGFLRRAAHRFTPDTLARTLDSLADTGGRIRVGVDLAKADLTSSPLSAGLAAVAVADAGRLAGSVPAARVAPIRPARWPVLAVAAWAGAAFTTNAVLPDLADAEWPRFADPYGDHPPYSRVKFRVEPGDTRVVYGQSFDVRVTVAGAAVDRVDLILEPTDGAAAEVLPLFPEADGVWRTTVTRVVQPVNYFVRAGGGRSRRFAADVITVPRIEAVRVRVTPPPYTHLPAYEGPVPPGGLAGLPGTRVELWAASNRPLSAARIHLPAAPPRNVLVADEQSEAKVDFEIAAAGNLRLMLTDTTGQESTEAFQTPITFLTDDPPTIRLLQPREISLATPTAVIPVVVAAEDDYGLARVQVFRSLNQSRPVPVAIPVGPPPAIRVAGAMPLALAGYGLKPGDEIRVFARAEDTDPAGAKRAETPVAVVRIISQEEFEKLVQARAGLDVMAAKYRQALRRAEAAAAATDELRKKRAERNRTGPTKDDDRAEAKALADRLRAEAAAIRAAEHPIDVDLDKNLTPMLERLAKELDDAAKGIEAQLDKGEKLTQEELDAALRKTAESLDRERSEFDRGAIDPIETLQSILPLLRDEDRFVALVKRQRALATKLAELKEKDPADAPADRTKFREFRAEQEAVRTELADLLDAIEEHVAKLPMKPELDELRQSAKEFVDAVRQSGAAEAMTDAEAGMGDFSGKRGHAGAAKAADVLEKLLGGQQTPGGKGMAGAGRRALRFAPGLGDALGQTIEQLLGQGNNPGGQGPSGSGGSSANRQPQNLGLYGGLPGLGDLNGQDATTAAGQGRGSAAVKGGGGGPTGPGAAHGSSPSAAAAAAEAAVPAAYRSRVAEYFRRVADEAGGK